MTILDAAVQVLEKSGKPMTVRQIYEKILEGGLYRFGAKSPQSVLSGTLRNHLKTSPDPRIVEISKGTYGVR